MPGPRVALACMALAGWLLNSSTADARYYHRRGHPSAAARNRMIQIAQAQLGAARQASALAQVQMAQAQTKIDSSNSRIRGARLSMTTAKESERTAHDSLQEIFGRMLEKEGPDSEIGKAHAALVSAEEELDTAGKRIVNSDRYHEKIHEISALADRLEELPKVRAALFEEDNDYQAALARYKRTKVTYNQLWAELVRRSPEWMAMSQEVRDAWKEQNKAEVEGINGGFSHMSAWYKLHDAKNVYAAAQATIARSEYVLRRLGVKPPPPPPPVTTPKK